MFYISTLTSMTSTLILLTICVYRNFRQSLREQFSSVPRDEESSCNSNSTEDVCLKDPSEKDLFVSEIAKSQNCYELYAYF